MKTVRLLPVVIFASCSLLVFKSVGLLTNGGYVLSGMTPVQAAGSGHGGADGNAGGPKDESGAVLAPSEPTLSDTSPTLTDAAPTILEEAAGGAGHGAADAHGAPEVAADASAEEHGTAEAEEGTHDAPAADAAAEADAEALPGVSAEAHGEPSAQHETPADMAETACAPIAVAAAEHGAGAAPAATPVSADCPPEGDAIAMVEDGYGNRTPLTGQNGTSLTEQALLERLSERRAALDAFEAELELRSSLVEATEKRIAERTAALAEIEARITAMVDEKKALEDAQFKTVVAMYETMKPAEAAVIFNTLDMNVLLKVTRTMSARKMAPILARMTPEVAQQLTVLLTTSEPEPRIIEPGEDLASLPQIVGEQP